MNILGIEIQILSLLVGILLGLGACVLMVLIRKMFGHKPKFVNLKKEVEEGKEGVKRALKAFENFKDVLDSVEKNIR